MYSITLLYGTLSVVASISVVIGYFDLGYRNMTGTIINRDKILFTIYLGPEAYAADKIRQGADMEVKQFQIYAQKNKRHGNGSAVIETLPTLCDLPFPPTRGALALPTCLRSHKTFAKKRIQSVLRSEYLRYRRADYANLCRLANYVSGRIINKRVRYF